MAHGVAPLRREDSLSEPPRTSLTRLNLIGAAVGAELGSTESRVTIGPIARQKSGSAPVLWPATKTSRLRVSAQPRPKTVIPYSSRLELVSETRALPKSETTCRLTLSPKVGGRGRLLP